MAGLFWDPGFGEGPSSARTVSYQTNVSKLTGNSGFSIQSVAQGTVDQTAAVYWNQLNTGNTWETVLIGGQPLPGLAYPHATAGKRVQKQKAPGRDGASHVVLGYDPGDVEIDCRIWTPDQYEQLLFMMSYLWPRPNKAPIDNPYAPQALVASYENQPGTYDGMKVAWDIIHPALDVLGIKFVTIVSVSSLEPDSVPGVFACKLKCWEWVKPSPKAAGGKVFQEKAQVAPSHDGTAGQGAANAPPPAPSMSVQPNASWPQ